MSAKEAKKSNPKPAIVDALEALSRALRGLLAKLDTLFLQVNAFHCTTTRAYSTSS